MNSATTSFEVGIGAEAIKKVLNRIDTDAEKVKLRAI